MGALFGNSSKSQTTVSNVTSTDSRSVLAAGAQLVTGGSSMNVSSTVNNYIGTVQGSIGLDGWATSPTSHVQAAAAATNADTPKLPTMTLLLAGVVLILMMRGHRGQ